MGKFAWGWVALLLALPGGDGAAAGFDRIQKAFLEEGGGRNARFLPDDVGVVLTGRNPAAVEEWRTAYSAFLARAKVREVREGPEDAVVVLGESTEATSEVLLRRNGTSFWFVASPQAYRTGKALDSVNGKGPAEVRLSSRTRNEAYGDSAFSFAHVTRKPEQCAGRMDLWYCHNGDLHGVADTRLARVAAKDLNSVTGIPEGAAWKDTLAPAKGGVYVIHCRREGHRDFYVKARVTTVDEKSATLEWQVLAAGFGSPATIDAPHPIDTRDGPDGWDGLCGKNRERSKPEPAPGPAKTTPR